MKTKNNLNLPANFQVVGRIEKEASEQLVSYTLPLEEWIYLSKGIAEMSSQVIDFSNAGYNECLKSEYMGNAVTLANDINNVCHEFIMEGGVE